MDNDNQYIPHRHRNDDAPKDKKIRLRNWLNIIFMVGAIIGVLVYVLCNHDIGIIIVLAAMIFKIMEVSLRFLQ